MLRYPTGESAMTDAEFNRLLDAVRTAIAPVPGEDVLAKLMPVFSAPPRAANDNQVAWPLFAFPDGWNAAC
jgi:hypothetical protein